MPDGPVSGPSAWYGQDLATSTEWMYTLSDTDLDELHGALGAVREKGLAIVDIGRADFPLPRLGATLDALRGDLLRGRGFVVMRGLPLDRYSLEDAAILYWGIGSYFGKTVPQNAKGHVLGHVTNLGRDQHDVNSRIYQTCARQEYHTDNCDVVSLLCLSKAKSGGLSSLVSSVTLYNEILARRPDLLPVLFRPFDADRRGEVPKGRNPYYTAPIFNWHEGELTTQFVPRYIKSARRFEELPPLTDAEGEAIGMIESLAEDPSIYLRLEFEPGDMQFVHNHQLLHDRTAFEDGPDHKRHLLRLWLCPSDGRPLPEGLRDKFNGGLTVGDRGGMFIPGAVPHAPLDPV